MSQKIPVEFLDFFKKRAFAHLATIMPDGSPHVTPVWVDYDGKYLIITSTRTNQKVRNITRQPRVAVSIQDPDDPYRYLLVRGNVVKMSEEGAEEMLDNLAVKYTGSKFELHPPKYVHVKYMIEPEHIATSGR